MSQLTCIACQLTIHRGQRAISLEFGQVEQSQKSQRNIIMGYATDVIHFECIHTYLGRIDGELYNSIMDHHKQIIKKKIIDEMKDELRQEVYDEVVDEVGRTCSVCQAELDESVDDEIDPPMDPVVQKAMVQGLPSLPPPPTWPVQHPPLPTMPFVPPPAFNNGHNK